MERAKAQLAELNAALEAEQTARSAAERDAKDKGEKLERLESECSVGGRMVPSTVLAHPASHSPGGMFQLVLAARPPVQAPFAPLQMN